MVVCCGALIVYQSLRTCLLAEGYPNKPSYIGGKLCSYREDMETMFAKSRLAPFGISGVHRSCHRARRITAVGSFGRSATELRNSSLFSTTGSVLHTSCLDSVVRHSSAHAPNAIPTLSTQNAAAAESVAAITIYRAADGSPVQFQDLWDQRNGVALVAFLRHFGCPYCWKFAGQLRDAKPALDATGVKLITVGVGKPDKAQLMAGKVNFPIECLYCDDNRKAYSALSLPSDARTFFFPNPSPLPKLISSFDSIRGVLSNGYKLSVPEDKTGVLQQGGLFVFRGQDVLYERKEKHVGDHPDIEELLDVCFRTGLA